MKDRAMNRKLTIAIDGPAGAGKSTASKLLAQRVGLLYLDTGAMYRALTLKIVRNKVISSDTDKIIELARNSRITFANGGRQTILDGEDVSEEIREPEVEVAISEIVKIPEVRKVMVKKQRQIAKDKGVVAEGRDITTVVFPNADLKIYLTASVETRAKRRYAELRAKGIEMGFDEITQQIKRRDQEDKRREHGPLRKADDAVIIDSKDLTVDEVVEKIVKLVPK